MSEEQVVRNCAPTLAGLKTGNLFACPYENREDLLDFLRSLNRRLGKKGVRAVPLRIRQDRALIYLYRPARLKKTSPAHPAKRFSASLATTAGAAADA